MRQDQLTKLRALIDAEPANASRTDIEVVQWLRTPETQTTYKRDFLSTASIQNRLGRVRGAEVLEALEAAAVTDNSIKWGMRYIDQRGIDLSEPESRDLLDGLVAAGIIAADERTLLLAPSKQLVSIAEKESMTEVRSRHVNAARAL